ncbi:hypothetical protein [Methylobacterium sp. JK268]
MTLAERLEGHAIIDRLVADEPTFAAADARRLMALVPVRPSRLLTVNVRSWRETRPRDGDGHGRFDTVAVDAERTWSSDPEPVPRIGGYEVTHVPGRITIGLIWAGAGATRTGRFCQLIYDKATGEPREMRIARRVTLAFLFLLVAAVRYLPWKAPRHGEAVA